MKKAIFKIVTAAFLVTAALSSVHAEGSGDWPHIGDATSMLTPKPRKAKDSSSTLVKQQATSPAHGESGYPTGEGQNPKSVEERDAAQAKRVAARTEKRGGKPSRVTPVSPSAVAESELKHY